MNPFRDAQAVYDREPSTRTFYEDLLIHLELGYVFSTPDYFIMGRPVRTDATIDHILNPEIQFSDPDCWLIWLAAGKGIESFFQLEPFPLPYFGWQKRQKIRFYRREQLARYDKRSNRKCDLFLQGSINSKSSASTETTCSGYGSRRICKI